MIWNCTSGGWSKKPIRMIGADLRAAFLCCPGPSLMGVHDGALYVPGATVFAINNSWPRIGRPDYWIGGDSPECYHPDLMLTSFQKIFPGGGGSEKATTAMSFNTHFVDCDQKPFLSNNNEDMVSFPRSTFLFALELIIKMGFKRIYLVGCDLSHDKGDYWHDDALSDEYREANKVVHCYIFEQLLASKEKLHERGVTLFSCSPDSPLNGAVAPFVPVYQAANREHKSNVQPGFRYRHVLEIKGVRDENGKYKVVGFAQE